MQLWFNSLASGGTGNGDWSSGANYWEDSANTIPHNTPATSIDDVILQDSPQLGSSPVRNLTDAGTNPIGGADIESWGTSTGITLNAGRLFIGGTGAGTIGIVGCTFNVDPGFGGALGSTSNLVVNSSGGCVFNCDLMTQDVIKFVGDGTEVWGSGTYNFWNLITPIINAPTAIAFSTNQTAGDATDGIQCNSIYAPLATISNPGGSGSIQCVRQTGANVNLVALTFSQPVVWDTVTSIGTRGVTNTNYSVSGGVASLVLPGSGGTVQLPSLGGGGGTRAYAG